jgi:hypothetical protein
MRTKTRYRAGLFLRHGAIRREIMYREMESVRGLKRISRKGASRGAKLHAAATRDLGSGDVALLENIGPA